MHNSLLIHGNPYQVIISSYLGARQCPSWWVYSYWYRTCQRQLLYLSYPIPGLACGYIWSNVVVSDYSAFAPVFDLSKNSKGSRRCDNQSARAPSDERRRLKGRGAAGAERSKLWAFGAPQPHHYMTYSAPQSSRGSSVRRQRGRRCVRLPTERV